MDGLIATLFQYMDLKYTALNQFASEMSSLSQLVTDVNTAKDKIESLDGAFGELESLLVELEDICDQRNHVKKKLEHEHQLKKYQQNKHLELEQVKVMQAKTHAARVQKFEEQISLVLQERQKVFEEAHREQMIKYMTTGQVDKLLPSPLHSANLADIEIDQDAVELDEFLGSVEENEPPGEKPMLEEDTETEEELDNEQTSVVLEDEDCNAGNTSDDLVSEPLPDGGTLVGDHGNTTVDIQTNSKDDSSKT